MLTWQIIEEILGLQYFSYQVYSNRKGNTQKDKFLLKMDYIVSVLLRLRHIKNQNLDFQSCIVKVTPWIRI